MRSMNHQLFLQTDDVSITYEQLYSFTEEFAGHIRKICGKQHPDITLLLPDSYWSVLIIAACWLKGFSFFPLSTKWSSREINKRLSMLQGDILITTRSLKSTTNIDNKPCFLLDDIQEISLTTVEKSAIETTNISPEAQFATFFTSGTTGRPKQVPLKRRQMISACQSSAQNFLLKPGEYWLLSLPLDHIGGVAVILRSLIQHSAVYVCYPFSANKTAQIIRHNFAVKAVSLVPTMLNRVIKSDPGNPHKYFKAILIGGSSMHNELIEFIQDHNWPVFFSYGMTETCAQIAASVVCKTDFGGGLDVFNSNEVQIRNKAGTPLGPHASGLIWLKGPQVFDGYRNKALNETAFDNKSWFCTGDFGYMDNSGRLHIENRRSDIVISGGENIDIREVEQALTQIDPIVEAAVFGRPDKHWGERLTALVVLNDLHQHFEAEHVNKKLRKVLAPFKIPGEYVVIASLPRTSIGKIKRDELPDIYRYYSE